MPEQTSFTGSLDLNFFPSATFESLKGLNSVEQRPLLARNALRLLMMGWQSWFSLLSLETLKAVFVERDPELIRELRFAFQCGFDHLFSQLQNKEFNADQLEQIQLYLSNCLCLLPLADLTRCESIKIPKFIENQWVMVDYYVTPIELTQNTGVNKYILQDEDRVFAYGLEPINNPKAKSHLIFMGTTYPAGQGFLPQVKSDMKGFETVGKSLYRSGRERILKWINSQQNKIDVSGLSLGGSLSLLLAIDQGDKLSRVDAMNPAGLHDAWRKSRFDHWDEFESKPKVVIQQQASDPVSLFGVWKIEWNIFKVIPPKEKQGPNAFTDHFLNYAGFANTEFQQVSAEEDNKQRRKRNFWLYSFGRSIIYYPILLPFSYVVRPVAHFIWEKKSYFIATLLPLIMFGFFAGLGLLSGYILLTAGVSLMLSACCFALAYAFNHTSPDPKSDNEQPKLHDPALPRNPTMDIYNNTLDIQISYKELNTYYQVTRCLTKNKSYLPSHERLSKHTNGMTKKDLLDMAQDPARAEQIISLKVSKAKAVHIQHTLASVKQLSGQDSSVLKSVLEEDYANYALGKR